MSGHGSTGKHVGLFASADAADDVGIRFAAEIYVAVAEKDVPCVFAAFCITGGSAERAVLRHSRKI